MKVLRFSDMGLGGAIARVTVVLRGTLLLGTLLLGALLMAAAARAADPSDLGVYLKNDRSTDIQELLASHRLDPNKTIDKGMPILMQAVRDGAWKSFDVLFANPRIELNATNEYDETPLMYVALVGDVPRAKKMIVRGAQVNRLGWTPLHYASAKGQTEMVKLLLANDAMPNAPSPEGDSPLMTAIGSNNLEVVQVLINAGADPVARNLAGVDAIDIANQKGNKALAKALEKVVADRRAKDRKAQ